MCTARTWKSSERCRVLGSNCFVTRYPGRPIFTAHRSTKRIQCTPSTSVHTAQYTHCLLWTDLIDNQKMSPAHECMPHSNRCGAYDTVQNQHSALLQTCCSLNNYTMLKRLHQLMLVLLLTNFLDCCPLLWCGCCLLLCCLPRCALSQVLLMPFALHRKAQHECMSAQQLWQACTAVLGAGLMLQTVAQHLFACRHAMRGAWTRMGCKTAHLSMRKVVALVWMQR